MKIVAKKMALRTSIRLPKPEKGGLKTQTG